MGIPRFGDTPFAESPEAAALEAEFRTLTARYTAAGATLNIAEDAVVYPPVPEALLCRLDDRGLLLCGSPVRDYATKREAWIDLEGAEALRVKTFANRPPEERAEAIARRDEIVAAYDCWRAETRAAEDAVGYPAAYAAWMATLDENDAFRRKLAQLRTTDPTVMRVKAMVILERCGEVAFLDVLVSNATAIDGPHEEAMAMSLVRDFIAREGLTV